MEPSMEPSTEFILNPPTISLKISETSITNRNASPVWIYALLGVLAISLSIIACLSSYYCFVLCCATPAFAKKKKNENDTLERTNDIPLEDMYPVDYVNQSQYPYVFPKLDKQMDKDKIKDLECDPILYTHLKSPYKVYSYVGYTDTDAFDTHRIKQFE